ncbi:hypothetical protein FHG87_023661 [Trinorchestia longiramus]|nr:hypothetical protein FHG87_023661 [Trinorchestia longiramus]
MSSSLISFKDSIKDAVPDFELDPRLRELGDARYSELVSWFNKRLDDAIRAAEEEKKDGFQPIFSAGAYVHLLPRRPYVVVNMLLCI